jgi:hypothetical protein
VRQAVLCNGKRNANAIAGVTHTDLFRVVDITLEGANEEGTFSGKDAIHQCRDLDAVKNFLVEHRANDYVRNILHT